MQSSPEDLGEILRLLPSQWHEQFLAESRSALDAARDVSRFLKLRDVLNLWRLRAAAYSGPGFEEAMQAARDDRAEEFVPAEQSAYWGG